MVTQVARQTPAGARPNKRREAVLFDQDAAGRLLEDAGDCVRREMTVRSDLLRQNPAYRPGDSLSRLLRFIGRNSLAVAFASACRAPVPQQQISPSAPVAAPASGLPVMWIPAPDLLAKTYQLEQRAWVVTTTDSSTAADSSFLSIGASIRSTDGGSIAGLVHSALAAAPGTRLSAIPQLTVPFAFVAERTQGARGVQPNPVANPASDDPCASSAHAVLGSLRDFLLYPPDTLVIGREWADSGSVVTCRDGARLSVGTRRSFRVAGHDRQGGRDVLVINRTSHIHVFGSVARGVDTTFVEGSGSGTMRIIIDAASAHLLSADGRSTLDLVVRGTVRSETARQTVVSSAVLRNP